MSLFNETVQRLAKAEARILELENENAQLRESNKRLKTMSYSNYSSVKPREQFHADLNTLSDDDVEELFRQNRESKLDDLVHAHMAESEDAADLKPASNGVPVRSRLWAPVLKMCALLRVR